MAKHTEAQLVATKRVNSNHDSTGAHFGATFCAYVYLGSDYIYHRHSTLADQIRATCMTCEGVESRVLFGFCNRHSILVAQLCVTCMKCEGLEHCARARRESLAVNMWTGRWPQSLQDQVKAGVFGPSGENNAALLVTRPSSQFLSKDAWCAN